MSEIRLLKIAVPVNWAGMENVIYSFNVTATSTTNASIGNTSLAELKVKADKRSMAEYSKLEAQCDKNIMQPDAAEIKKQASQIIQDLEKAKDS